MEGLLDLYIYFKKITPHIKIFFLLHITASFCSLLEIKKKYAICLNKENKIMVLNKTKLQISTLFLLIY